MAELTSFMQEKLICLDLKSKTKAEVFEEMSDLISRSESVPDRETFLSALKEREAVMTTGIGMGVGIPHARSDSIERLVIAIGVSQEGIDFGAVDDQLVRVVFMIGIPASEPKLYLQVLAAITRFARKQSNRERLLSAKSEAEVFAVLDDFDRISR
ncbi:PTS sugar transporter subunit IIA [bacterium]|nr:PTS sugar transporter subunit IIA [bacterium]